MFRQPETPIPGILGALCQVECVGKCVSGGEAFADIGEVEYGELNDGATLAHARRHTSSQGTCSSRDGKHDCDIR